MNKIAGLVVIIATSTTISCSLNDNVRSTGSVRQFEYVTHEGTQMDVDVSPDGALLLFSLLGDIYVMPSSGGESYLLRGGSTWDSNPRFSPDGSRIAYLSDHSSGMGGLWVMSSTGESPTRIAENVFGSLSWSADGRMIHGSARDSQRASTRHVAVSIEGISAPHTCSRDPQLFSRDYSSSPSDRFLYFVATDAGAENRQKIVRCDLLTGTVYALVSSLDTAFFGPTVSPKRRSIAYFAIDRNQEHAERSSFRIDVMPIGGGAARTLIELGLHDRSAAFGYSPDGEYIYASVGGRIAKVGVFDGTVENIPMTVRVTKEIPKVPLPSTTRDLSVPKLVKRFLWFNLANDQKTAVFSAIGTVWVADLISGAIRRLTQLVAREYAPSISPSGDRVVYVTWDDSAYGAVRITDQRHNQETVTIAANGFFANPIWSPDGTKVAFLRAIAGQEKAHFSYGMKKKLKMLIQVVDLNTGKNNTVATIQAPYATLYGHYTSLQFDAEGKRLFFMRVREHRNPSRRELVSIDTTGLDERVHLVMDNKVDRVVLSHDTKRIAIVRRTGVFVLELGDPATTLASDPLTKYAHEVRRISHTAPAYLSWTNDDSLVWTIGRIVHKWESDSDDAFEFADLSLELPVHRPEGSFAFVNARIVSMGSRGVIENGTVMVQEDRIVAVGAANHVSIPSDTTIVDASGKTIIPGLIDSHAHMHFDLFGATEYIPKIKREYLAALAYGVTTVFDPSSPNSVFAQAEMVEAGVLLGPRVFSTGPVFHPHPGSFKYVPLLNTQTARSIVGNAVAAGAYMLKSYGHRNYVERSLLKRAAREFGVQVVGHNETSFVGSMTMIEQGFSIVEHAIPIPMYDDVIQFLSASQTFITPTVDASVAALQGGPFSEFSRSGKTDPKYLWYSLRGPNRTRSHISFGEQQGYQIESDAVLQNRLTELAKLVRAGANVVAGSHSHDGLALHWELALFAEGGLAAEEVLKLATVNGARKLGQWTSLGSIERGKLADLVILNANPLDNIRNTERIAYVVKGGVVYDAMSMTQLWPEYKPLPLTRPLWHSIDESVALRPELPEPWPGVPIAASVEVEQRTIH